MNVLVAPLRQLQVQLAASKAHALVLSLLRHVEQRLTVLLGLQSPHLGA
jgi:hypothetical protein